MSTKVGSRSKAIAQPGQEGKTMNAAAYRMLGARLGYIAGEAIAVEKRAGFEHELARALGEAIEAGATPTALNIIDGFTVGYDQAKAEADK